MDQETKQVGYTSAGLSEFLVQQNIGPPPETTQDRTQSTHTQSRLEIKMPAQPVLEPGSPSCKTGILPTRHSDGQIHKHRAVELFLIPYTREPQTKASSLYRHESVLLDIER